MKIMVFKRIKILAIGFIVYRLITYKYGDIWWGDFVQIIGYATLVILICEIAIHVKEMRNK